MLLALSKFLGKLLKILNSEISPRQIASGFALGAVLGLVPASGLMPLVLTTFALLINVNLTMVFLGAAVFKLLSFALDPVSSALGYQLLVKMTFLKGFWTTLYNTPIVPYTRFNNTIVLGSLVVGLILFVPLYLVGVKAVGAYRGRWQQKIVQWKIVQMFKASAVYKFYAYYKGIREP